MSFAKIKSKKYGWREKNIFITEGSKLSLRKKNETLNWIRIC
jgi:hypothetical protein